MNKYYIITHKSNGRIHSITDSKEYSKILSDYKNLIVNNLDDCDTELQSYFYENKINLISKYELVVLEDNIMNCEEEEIVAQSLGTFSQIIDDISFNFKRLEKCCKIKAVKDDMNIVSHMLNCMVADADGYGVSYLLNNPSIFVKAIIKKIRNDIK